MTAPDPDRVDGSPIDIRDVARGLAQHIEALAGEIFPAGRNDRHAGQWCIGSLAGEPGQSLRIELRGEKQGLWCEHADGTGGDALDLVAQVLCRGDRAEARRWGIQWLGLSEDERQARRPPAPPPKPPESDDEKRQRAHGRWLSASPHLRGTPAADYLLGRGIDLARLGRQPGALRYHAELWTEGRHWPAMVALIQDGAGRPIGCHRTFLARDQAGRWGKAPIGGGAKKVLGLHTGGMIPLWRGASGVPIRQAPEGDRVIICEGIEDGLTLALAAPDYRVLACVTIGNMQHLVLPPAIREVLIAGDNDPEMIRLLDGRERPHPARLALAAAIRRWQHEGRRVLIAFAGGGAKDFNDRLRGGA